MFACYIESSKIWPHFALEHRTPHLLHPGHPESLKWGEEGQLKMNAKRVQFLKHWPTGLGICLRLI